MRWSDIILLACPAPPTDLVSDCDGGAITSQNRRVSSVAPETTVPLRGSGVKSTREVSRELLDLHFTIEG